MPHSRASPGGKLARSPARECGWRGSGSPVHEASQPAPSPSALAAGDLLSSLGRCSPGYPARGRSSLASGSASLRHRIVFESLVRRGLVVRRVRRRSRAERAQSLARERTAAERVPRSAESEQSEVEDELQDCGHEDHEEQDADGDGGAGPHGWLLRESSTGVSTPGGSSTVPPAPSGTRVTPLPARRPSSSAADARSRQSASRP